VTISISLTICGSNGYAISPVLDIASSTLLAYILALPLLLINFHLLSCCGDHVSANEQFLDNCAIISKSWIIQRDVSRISWIILSSLSLIWNKILLLDLSISRVLYLKRYVIIRCY